MREAFGSFHQLWEREVCATVGRVTADFNHGQSKQLLAVLRRGRRALESQARLCWVVGTWNPPPCPHPPQIVLVSPPRQEKSPMTKKNQGPLFAPRCRCAVYGKRAPRGQLVECYWQRVSTVTENVRLVMCCHIIVVHNCMLAGAYSQSPSYPSWINTAEARSRTT